MASCQLSELRDRVSRVVVRRPGSGRVRIIKGSGLRLFLALNAKTQVSWDDTYKCYVGKPTKCIGTLMVFAG